LGSCVEGSKNPSTHISTLKSMDEVAIEVMQANNVVKLFKTITIMNLHMGNLNLEVSNLNNRLAIEEKEKAIL